MPQTKFVVGKALRLGLNPIVLINKVDKPEQRAFEVQDETFDLFAALDANEAQLDFPTLFSSAKQGWAAADPDERPGNMDALFDMIVAHVPPPKVDPDAAFSMLATTVERDPYLGRILTGRILTGKARPNMAIRALDREGNLVESGRISKLLAFRGLQREPVEEAQAGDIVTIAGMTDANVSHTLAAPEVTEAIPAQPIDPSTLAMTFSINDSPLAGLEGDKVTSRLIRDRLMREAEGNVAIQVRETEEKDAFEVSGRGELQLAVLIESMRREGFELSVSRPRVLFRANEQGQREEPIEEVVIDVDEEYSGSVVEKLGQRRAEMQEMRPAGAGKTRLVFHAPSRGLIGYHGEFLTDTRGTGVMNRVFSHYAPYKGPIETRRAGVLISLEQGKAIAYALYNLEERGFLFVSPGEPVYQGMILGEHAKGQDLDVNPLKAKQLTNFRASGKDDALDLTPPVRMTLEKALAYIDDDELVEVTPQSVRLRKRYLDIHERKKNARRAAG